jgi:hypothetical protein
LVFPNYWKKLFATLLNIPFPCLRSCHCLWLGREWLRKLGEEKGGFSKITIFKDRFILLTKKIIMIFLETTFTCIKTFANIKTAIRCFNYEFSNKYQSSIPGTASY